MGLMIFRYLSCILFLGHYSSATDDLLEFLPFLGANKLDSIYLTDRNPGAFLDAVSKTSRSIYFLGTNELTKHAVTLDCRTSSRTIPLSNIQLCCRSDAEENAECHSVMTKSPQGLITCNNMEFSYTADPISGAKFTLSFNPIKLHSFPYNALISCSLSDNTASLRSTELIFHDASYYASQLDIQPGNVVQKYIKPISPYDFPLPFKCGDFRETISRWPPWMKSIWQILAPYEWGYCPVGESNTPLSCAHSATPVNIGDGITTMDGTLMLLTDRLLRTHPNSAFVCLLKISKSPIRTYAHSSTSDDTPKILKGLSIDFTAKPIFPEKLISLSETSSDLVFIEGTFLNNFFLRAFYRKPVNKSVEFHWYKDGEEIMGNDVREYSLLLPSNFDRKLGGHYELKVSSPSLKDLVFTFNVRVVGPPKFINNNCVDDLFYVMEGSDIKIICTMVEGASEIRVGINGIESTTAKGLKKRLLAAIDISGKPISQLDIDFTLKDSKSSERTINIIVRNLRKNQDFRISVGAYNAYGHAQLAGSIRIIPKPNFIIPPSLMSCNQNCSDAPFEVQCILDDNTVEMWHNVFGIFHLQSWLIDRTWTLESLQKDPSLSGFFKFDPDLPTSIEISPLVRFDNNSESNATLQTLLETKTGRQIKELIVECRIRLYVNNSRAQFERVKSSADDHVRRRRAIGDEKNIIYDSYYEQESQFSQNLMSKRRLSSNDPEPALAGLSWILAILISLLILLLVIVLSVWLCTRDRGESYNAYRKELKMGKDPLLELKHNSTFQPFERPEGPPLPATRGSISGDSVNYGSDEEGELDDYNLDPGHFNEEASYIGQYGLKATIPDTSYSKAYPLQPDHHTAV